jgi:hypothetical protein
MPRNFLISYSGRVGSTALIDTLKLIPGFLVPVFEDLDFYAIKKAGLLDQHSAENIHLYVDHIYRNSPGPDLSVGFKWRMWGDLERIAEVLVGHNVVVFNLVRADLFEYVSSIYLSDVVNKDFNAPQFLLRDASTEEERDKILFKYRMMKHGVDVEKFFGLLEQHAGIERARFEQLTHLQSFGCDIVTIFYEDFSYKRFGFLNNVMRLLGHRALDFVPVIKLAKVSPAFPSELFHNRGDLLAANELMPLLNKWEQDVVKFPRLP